MFEGLTIDPELARDLDDAIFVEGNAAGWLLKVAFPRVASYLPPGSPDDLRAAGLGFTRYRGASARESMLPEDVADALTLAPGADRDVYVVSIPFDPSFTRGDPTVEATTFRSLGRLSYAQATRGIADPSHEHFAVLSRAYALAKGIARRRTASGAVAYKSISADLETDEEGDVVRIDHDVHAAEVVVREAMVATNAALAELAMRTGKPLLYRNHVAYARLTNAAPGTSSADLGRPLPWDSRRNPVETRRAHLGTQPVGHYALGLPAYAWFTSPIRRYADVVNQRLVADALEGAPPTYGPEDLATLAESLNATAEAHRTETIARNSNAMASRASRAIEAGRTRQADDGEFKAIVKAAAAARNVPEELLQEALRRFRDGRLHAKQVARLIFVGGPVGQAMVDELGSVPYHAVQVFNYGHQSLGWHPLRMKTERLGPVHRPEYRAVATLQTPDGTFVSPPATAPAQKDATQAATLAAIAIAAGVAPPRITRPARPQAALVAAANDPSFSPRSTLIEVCTKARWPMPTVSSTPSGPPHAPEYASVALLDLGDRRLASKSHKHPTKKGSERAAFAELLCTVQGMLANPGGARRGSSDRALETAE